MLIYGDDGTKVLKISKDMIIDQIRRGYKETTEQVYGVAYFEEGIMVIYDSEGQYLYQRMLTKNEQANPKIFSLSKAQ